jgi:hypothetical protein
MAEPTTPPVPAPATVPAGSITLYDPQTKAPVTVAAEDAPGHILAGRLNYVPGQRIPVKVNGQIGTVDADALGDAVAKYGAKPVTGAQYHEHEQQKKYGDTLHAAEAFGVSALDSATLGASNALIGGLGGKGVREHLRGVTEANPNASTAGDVVGFVAPVAADVLSGGSLTPGIAAAEGARLAERGIARTLAKGAAETALLGPTRLLSKAGGLAEAGARALVGREAESAAARTAQNIIAGGVRGAVEGGIAGVGTEVGHQYLQDDPALSGEALASAFTHGALIGGALGGVLHGVGGMLTTKKAPAMLGERGDATLAGSVDRKALSGGVEAAELGADEAAVKAADHGKAPGEKTVADQAAKRIIDQVDDPKARATLEKAWTDRGPHGFAKHDELVGDATRKVVKSLDASLEAGHIVDMATFGEAKATQMAALVPAENIGMVKKAATHVWDESMKVLDELDSYAAKGGGEPSIKRLKKQLTDLVTKTEGMADPASGMMAIDSFKRAVGKETAYGTNPFGRTDAAHAFDALYEKIRLVLEDESVFGRGAVAQKEVNQATTEMLGTSRFFNGKYTVSYDSKAGVPIYRANDASIDGFMKNLTRPSGDLNTEAFADKINRRRAFLDAVTKNYTYDAAGKSAIATDRAALDTMEKTIAHTSTEVAHVNQLKALMADEGHASKIGHSIPVLGGIIGLAVDSVTKPGMSLARLAELEAMKNRIIAKVDDGVASVKTALRGDAEHRRKPGLPPHDRDTYEKRRASVLNVASQPEVVQAHIAGATGPMSQRAPGAAAAFQTSAIRTVQYLMAALPKPPPPKASSLTPQLDMESWQPSDQQKSQFARKFDMVTHPEHALQLVAAGTITAQHVEALQATNPQSYAMQAKKLQAELAALKKPVPLDMQGPIRTFLGIPQMDPDTQRLMMLATPKGSAQGPEGAPPQGPHRPLKLADNMTLNASGATRE